MRSLEDEMDADDVTVVEGPQLEHAQESARHEPDAADTETSAPATVARSHDMTSQSVAHIESEPVLKQESSEQAASEEAATSAADANEAVAPDQEAADDRGRERKKKKKDKVRLRSCSLLHLCSLLSRHTRMTMRCVLEITIKGIFLSEAEWRRNRHEEEARRQSRAQVAKSSGGSATL